MYVNHLATLPCQAKNDDFRQRPHLYVNTHKIVSESCCQHLSCFRYAMTMFPTHYMSCYGCQVNFHIDIRIVKMVVCDQPEMFCAFSLWVETRIKCWTYFWSVNEPEHLWQRAKGLLLWSCHSRRQDLPSGTGRQWPQGGIFLYLVSLDLCSATGSPVLDV